MSYTRAILEHVEGYVPGEQPAGPGVIKLNTNENPYPPSPRVLEAVRAVPADSLRRYPDPVSARLREACARRYGYDSADWIIAGNGMDEVLAMAIRTFVDPGDTVVSVDPTYTLYETLAKLHGARFEAMPLSESYALPEALFTSTARMCFVPRPNAPSGVPAPRATMEKLCTNFRGLVFIDEAYADFAEDNCMDFPKRFPNVIVGRTFSKSLSLAGLRLGTGTARPELIREFIKTKDSYNLNAIIQAAGIAAIEDWDYAAANIAKIKATRARLTWRLRDLGFSVPDSQANFVLARWSGTPPAREIFTRLRERKIFVRYFDTPSTGNALRISVGTDPETDRLLDAITAIVG